MAKDYMEELQKLLGTPIENICISFFDDFIQSNADFRTRSGLKEYIIRTELANCCEWCNKLAGVYEYTPTMDTEVFRKHDRCKCLVVHSTEKGTFKDVWSKKEFATLSEARTNRIKVINSESSHLSKQELKIVSNTPSGKKKANNIATIFTDKDNNSIITTNKQYGKKIGKHCIDFGLDARSEADRKQLEEIISNILSNYSHKYPGTFNGQGDDSESIKGRGDVLFYEKGNDIVIVSSDNKRFITILKDGVLSNGSVKNARREYFKEKEK